MRRDSGERIRGRYPDRCGSAAGRVPRRVLRVPSLPTSTQQATMPGRDAGSLSLLRRSARPTPTIEAVRAVFDLRPVEWAETLAVLQSASLADVRSEARAGGRRRRDPRHLRLSCARRRDLGRAAARSLHRGRVGHRGDFESCRPLSSGRTASRDRRSAPSRAWRIGAIPRSRRSGFCRLSRPNGSARPSSPRRAALIKDASLACCRPARTGRARCDP